MKADPAQGAVVISLREPAPDYQPLSFHVKQALDRYFRRHVDA